MSGQNVAAGIGQEALVIMEALLDQQKIVGAETGVRKGWIMRTNHGEFRIEITLMPQGGQQHG